MSLPLISLCVVAIRVAGVAFQAMIIVLLANTLSVSEMGLFSAIYIFWSMARGLGPMGLDQLSMRDIATATSQRQAQSVSNHSFAIVALVGVSTSAVTWVILYLVSSGGKVYFANPALVAAAFAVPAYAMNGLLMAQLRGFGRTIHSQVWETVTLHALSLAAMGALVHFSELTLTAAILIQTASAWIVLLIYTSLRLACGIDLRARLPAAARRKMVREAFQIWQAQCLSVMNERSPLYICLLMLGPAGTAIIDIANRFGTLPSIFSDGVATAFAPVFAKLHSGGDPAAYRWTLTLGSWLSFLPAAVAFIGLLACGPWLLATFFPPSYQHAFWPMVLICAATTVNAGCGLASNTFLMTHRQMLVRRYTGYSLLAVTIASVVLGWQFGALGVAAAILVGAVVRDGGLARLLTLEIGGAVMLNPALPRSLIRQAAIWMTWAR